MLRVRDGGRIENTISTQSSHVQQRVLVAADFSRQPRLETP
jgi:hypothetical protein